jgi:hypothetical protein
MNIHLIRSSELSIDTYTNVLNLLNKTQGPLTYFASKETDWETINYEKDWITEEQFKKAEQTNFDAERNMNYSLSRPSFTERHVFSCFDDDFPKIEKQATWDDLFSNCEKYRKTYAIPDNDLVILLTDISNDKNWFGSVDQKMRNIFIQTSNWSTFFGAEIDSRFPIAYEVVVWILRMMMYRNRFELSEQLHAQPKGCMMDFCEHKSQIVLKMRTADICGDCLDHIQARDINRTALNQILETMDGIRSNILFRERSSVLNRPSRLEIRGYVKRIFLVDLGDLEVRLNPKEKTLFLFFLNHPEGVRIVDLMDHKAEILDLYNRFSRASTPTLIENAVDLMLQPTDGNINQVLTRIRSKFKQTAGDSISGYYSIEGTRNEPYKISLNRELVKVIEN